MQIIQKKSTLKQKTQIKFTQFENAKHEDTNIENTQIENSQMDNTQMKIPPIEIFWTKEEDKILLDSIRSNGRKNWIFISKLLNDKTPNQCFYRYRKINPDLKKSKWTKEEDDLLISLQKTLGNNWSKISRIMKGRGPKQIRDRFINNLDPKILRGKFSIKEDLKIMELRNKYGNKWSLISKHFDNRSPDIIKSRYYSSIKNKKEVLNFLKNLWIKEEIHLDNNISNSNNDNIYNYNNNNNISNCNNDNIFSSDLYTKSKTKTTNQINEEKFLLNEYPDSEETETVNNSVNSPSENNQINEQNEINCYISKSPLFQAFEEKFEFDYNKYTNINFNSDFINLYDNYNKNDIDYLDNNFKECKHEILNFDDKEKTKKDNLSINIIDYFYLNNINNVNRKK
jgi:myb proto-oncogene protein